MWPPNGETYTKRRGVRFRDRVTAIVVVIVIDDLSI